MIDDVGIDGRRMVFGRGWYPGWPGEDKGWKWAFSMMQQRNQLCKISERLNCGARKDLAPTSHREDKTLSVYVKQNKKIYDKRRIEAGRTLKSLGLITGSPHASHIHYDDIRARDYTEAGLV